MSPSMSKPFSKSSVKLVQEVQDQRGLRGSLLVRRIDGLLHRRGVFAHPLACVVLPVVHHMVAMSCMTPSQIYGCRASVVV